MLSVRELKKPGRVVVRCDFDVPVDKGQITEDLRIQACIDTLKLLLKQRHKLFLISHLGRPVGKDNSLSLKMVLPKLEDLLGERVFFQENLDQATGSEIVLLENIRFWPEEENNNSDFAKKLASFGDAFVNECFSVSHRDHASIATIPGFIPGYVGLNLEKEIDQLTKVLKNPQHPSVAIIGGAKMETKLPAITNLAKVVNTVLVGGKLMFEARDTTLPANVVLATDDIETKDIGPFAVKRFHEEISRAKLVVWNGPMGMFEEEQYSVGTKAVAEAVIASGAHSVVGGGDTISALDRLGLLSKISFVSMGGGAMLDFLAGKKLPGLDALGAYA